MLPYNPPIFPKPTSLTTCNMSCTDKTFYLYRTNSLDNVYVCHAPVPRPPSDSRFHSTQSYTNDSSWRPISLSLSKVSSAIVPELPHG